MSLHIGGVMVGDRPAFQASVEVGTAIGHDHSVQLTSAYGVAATESAAYVGGLDLDYVATTEAGPIARIGPRLRASGDSTSLELRSTVFTGMFRDEKTGSGGLGVELAGGFDVVHYEPVYEFALVMHGRWPID